MPSPWTRVDIEYFVFVVSGIVFEFDFGDSIEPDRLEPLSSVRLQDGAIAGLNECARIAEINRVLPDSLGHQCCRHFAFVAERRAGKLALTGARDAFLNENLAGRNKPVHLREPG